MPVGRSRTVNRPASSVLVNWLRFAYDPPGSIHTPASGFPSGSTTVPLTETPGASVTVSATWDALPAPGWKTNPLRVDAGVALLRDRELDGDGLSGGTGPGDRPQPEVPLGVGHHAMLVLGRHSTPTGAPRPISTPPRPPRPAGPKYRRPFRSGRRMPSGPAPAT